MASQLPRRNSSNEVQELIDFNLNQGGLNYKLGPSTQHQDLSWLNVKNLNPQYTAPRKEMKKPPLKKRKVQQSKFESRLVTSHCTAKDFLQNCQMEKASKKDWDSDITHIRNIFALLTVWLNPIRIDARLGRYSHPYAANWVYFMWDTMMPSALKQFINQEDIRAKLEWKIKENTTLNKVHEFLANANIDEQLKQLIWINRQFYRFLYSACVHTIYMSVTEMHIQERFVETYTEWQSVAYGGWLSQQMNNPLMPQLQHPPLPPNTIVD